MVLNFNNVYFKYTILIVGTFLIAFILSRIIRFLITRFIKASSKILNIDHAKYNFLKNAVTFLIYLGAIIFIFYSVPKLKALGLTLFAGAGVLAAVAIFASQAAFSNIISGIFLVIFKPFRVDDIIEVGNLSKGRVEDITLRHTVIRNWENRRMVIPNSVISSEIIINSSIVDEHICNFIEIGISYDSDITKAIKIMQEEAMNHPHFVDHRNEEEKAQNMPPVIVRVIGFGDSSVNLRAYVWSKDHSSGFAMKSDLRKSIKEEFDKQGVEIPFPYRTIVYKKDIEKKNN